MKSWNESSQDAKNRRRAKPSGKIHTTKTKKPKHIRIECRYVGIDPFIPGEFGSNFCNPEWHHYWTKYAKLKDAEQAIANLNRKEAGSFEYRVKPEEYINE